MVKLTGSVELMEEEEVELRVSVRTRVVGVGDADPEETREVIVVVMMVWFGLLLVELEGVAEGVEEEDED